MNETPAMHPNAIRVAVVFTILGLMVLTPVFALVL